MRLRAKRVLAASGICSLAFITQVLAAIRAPPPRKSRSSKEGYTRRIRTDEVGRVSRAL